MHIAWKGLLVGLAVSALLYGFEYMAIKNAGAQRAKKMARKPEILQEERSRLRAVTQLCIFLPPGMALIFWLTMG